MGFTSIKWCSAYNAYVTAENEEVSAPYEIDTKLDLLVEPLETLTVPDITDDTLTFNLDQGSSYTKRYIIEKDEA
ncbi:unnamed protein product [Rotaria sordida]|uniref:Uncharacterized protein n=1 Tax=Rotaria sordida TaxID=392033 RepID=A0A818JHZ0_9BILA|nr:unnamed protein product [Rotaria sordida]CAF3536147.1 unnamed protein product [Rotaria sordida]